MKSIIFLYAGFEHTHAFDSLFSGESACNRVLVWAESLLKESQAQKIIIFARDGESANAVEKSVQEAVQHTENVLLVKNNFWSIESLISHMADFCTEYNAGYAVFTFADKPFLDSALTKEVLDTHTTYLAEYTFADGFPEGFAPEVIAAGTLKILSAILKEREVELGKDAVSPESIFSVIKTDINSFEIESVIAPKDFRMLRLDFSCGTKQNTLACKHLFEKAIEQKTDFCALSLTELAEKTASVQQTVPAYYGVQICTDYKTNALYNPAVRLEKGQHEKKVMDVQQFKSLVKHIADFSETAVVGLSAWGDPLLIENLSEYIKAVLAYPGLNVLIETDGLFLNQEQIANIERVVRESAVLPRLHKTLAPVTWIVQLDAFTPKMYALMHQCNSIEEATSLFNEAVKNVSYLEEHFAGGVYPQMVRMNANEEELEPFFRFWHAKDSPTKGRVIIQKYDSFCGILPDEKPADLAPLTRIPCWHIKRDMTILQDGTVPLCKEYMFEHSIGNVFEEGVETVWKKTNKIVEEHIIGARENNFKNKCKDCDEYYTFTF